ncbi:GNAT family N-acetyltransferase [Geopsychrobacter electrodiphilus]|uniref:GNAT family N-acetyltransferase n=1 Tax=Geopsychrobacter electrodiphilus TaxID=225196 RepID=UPI00036660CA|nr:GNAT family N-acetyltransferase [Geopsychrobacter electrodiphilus]
MLIDAARTADIPALCTLLASLFSQEAEFSPDSRAQQAGLKLIIENPEIGTILVARHGGQLVGMLNLLFTVSTALGGRVALLEDMVIAAAHRGTGIGTLLMGKALDFARQNSCQRITLLTDADNASAQRFYQRQGFNLSPMIAFRRHLA